MTDLFKYHYRPCYGSHELLIEIFTNVDRADFMDEFYKAIAVMEPVIEDVKDLWMNNEVEFSVRTKYGDLAFSKDSWGTAFVMSANQECLGRVNALLQNNSKFRKVEADPGNYK